MNEQGEPLPACKIGVSLTELTEGVVTCFAGFNLLLKLLSEYFLVAQRYLRVIDNHVQF